MPQVPKEHVRQGFISAAAETFATLGYGATTMGDVAARAGSSVGNLYKYFSSKQQLFDAAVPPHLVQELTRRTRARIRALGPAKDVRELSPSAQYHVLAGELLDYCLAHRAAVVVVLARAEGTPFADFSENFVTKLCEWALEYARVAYPQLKASPLFGFVLRRAYRSFVASVAEALRVFPDEDEARTVIGLFTAQHQAGLKHLFETQGPTNAQSYNSATPSVLSQAAGSGARNARPHAADPGATGPRAGQADPTRRARRRR